MIAVDTSALMAVALDEPAAPMVIQRMVAANPVLISAGTMAEALVVARRRNVGDGMAQSIEDFRAEIVPVTADFARRVADAYDRWGKGVHPAGLNFADCFAYALAMERGCPLLFVGEDFAKTDVKAALVA